MNRSGTQVAGQTGALDQHEQAYRLETLGQLTVAFTHDLNNLLGTIANCAALLGRHLTDQDDIDDADRIGGAVQRAAAMSRQLASLAGSLPTSPEPLVVNDVLRGMTALLELTAGPTIAVRLVLPAEPLVVVVDRQQIDLLILNLARNAAESMPRGGTLTIAADSASPTGAAYDQQVRLTVSDQGAGMGPQVVARAFDPFFTTKTKATVAGLGLTTVDGIVRRSGGRVTIDSVIGSGTTVTVTLPWADHLRIARLPGIDD